MSAVFCSARALCWYVRVFASNEINNSNNMTTEWWQLNNGIISSTKLCLGKKMTYGKSTEDRQSTSRAQASITPPVQLVVLCWDSLLSSREETFWSLMHRLADAWTYAYGLNRIRTFPICHYQSHCNSLIIMTMSLSGRGHTLSSHDVTGCTSLFLLVV